MKKAFLAATLTMITFLTIGYAIAQANCWQQYVCGPAGCRWVVVCR